jgi:hypothetical protein
MKTLTLLCFSFMYSKYSPGFLIALRKSVSNLFAAYLEVAVLPVVTLLIGFAMGFFGAFFGAAGFVAEFASTGFVAAPPEVEKDRAHIFAVHLRIAVGAAVACTKSFLEASKNIF